MRGLLAGLVVAAVVGPAAGQSSSATGGAFLGAHNNLPFTPTQAFAGPPPAVLAPPPPPPDVDPLTGEPVPPPPRLWKLWSGSLDAGLNGATGNTDLFNLRASGHAKRQTATNILTGDLLYTYTTDTGKVTNHLALLNARDELLFAGSRWTAFVSSLVEYDELRAYRFRVAVYAGAGYTVFDDKALALRLRAGAGAVRELGSTTVLTRTHAAAATGAPVTTVTTVRNRDQWVPEFVFGEDFRWAWNQRSSLLSVLDYYPRIDDPRQFRLRARVAYEFVLDPATAMIVRFGAQDRYDSSPGNAKRNDLSYFATFGVKF
jgi:hypothetical protein